ncbi:DUF2442 domain-containing protein [Pontibacter sp. 172403-2]|uniref:DUF2442 domain-containing protein n=1 Tax=Pontibacter rufus TaxID=2791028 RepID=UPI0018B014C9|nr:DUF2442 domain-containing protein [Pontibacter sp. 172403-2]MBF9254706.1 DUF2442 domain-containing protein [Pontibacter sp. 172403-2]
MIEEILSVDPSKLTLRFNTGEIRLVDLTAKLHEWSSNPQSKFAELQNFESFRKVRLDENFGSLVWENGIDLCPDVLYGLSTEINKKDVA